MAVEKYCLMECIMCGRKHAVRNGFTDGRSCAKCGGHLNFIGPITILAPPGSAVIQDVKRVIPIGVEVDDKQLDVALAKALKLETLLVSCQKRVAKIGTGLHVYEEDEREGGRNT